MRDNENDFLSIKQMARMAGKDPKTIRNWIHKGLLSIREITPRTKGMLRVDFMSFLRGRTAGAPNG